MQRVETQTTYVCDRCGEEQVDRPWRLKGKVRLTFNLLDYQGAAVAGADNQKELCDRCTQEVDAFIRSRSD